MKRYFAHLIAIGGLVLLLAGAGLAQDEIGYKLRANVPFDFYAGDTILPAGVYTFDLSPYGVVTVEQDSTSHAMYLSGMPADPVNNDKSVLTFKRVGNGYQLEELQGIDFGVELAPVTPGTTLRTVSAVGNESTAGGQH